MKRRIVTLRNYQDNNKKKMLRLLKSGGIINIMYCIQKELNKLEF